MTRTTHIDGQDQDKIIYGMKARDCKKEYLDQMLAKEEECLKSSPYLIG